MGDISLGQITGKKSASPVLVIQSSTVSFDPEEK